MSSLPECGTRDCKHYQAIAWPGFACSHSCTRYGNGANGTLRALRGSEEFTIFPDGIHCRRPIR
jgi:hypothetical protein